MKHSNISVFIPHTGCPHMCSFCNQHTISGAVKPPTGDEVRKTCLEAFSYIKDRKNCEIAFFGGSFTAVPEDYRNELLESVKEFLGEDGFSGIRVSTRPDCIDENILENLKYYGVTAIELGCQSMDDEVLRLNERGHSAEDVVKASELIRKYGFELGHQMMTGLYGSSPEKDSMTADRIIAIKPDTVRIYPTVILEGTKLAELFKSGEYRTYSLDEMVGYVCGYMERFEAAGIRIIKCGLHASETVEGEMVGGYYHPAFRELCESRKYRNILDGMLCGEGEYRIEVRPELVSKVTGQKRSNIDYFSQKGIRIKIVPSDQREEINVFKIT